jgi:lysophospholipase L1-like esterase
MKLPRRLRLVSGFVRLGAISILAFAAIDGDVLLAQTTNMTAEAPVVLPASMQYPTNLALLPGKGPIPSWKGFYPLWTKRRLEFMRHSAQDKGAVVFLGDSITQGWNGLKQDFPELKIANRGIGGDMTRGVWFRLKEDVLDLDPVAVVLLIGTNDLGNNGDPADAADNIRSILAELKKSNPKMPIIVCKVMPSKTSVAEKIEKLNALVDEIVKNDPQLIRCDTWSIYANPDGTCKKEEFPDMLHPNKFGYAKWQAQLNPIFAKLDLGNKKAE